MTKHLCLENFLGKDKKKLDDALNSLEKMAWEQVLLLMTYARFKLKKDHNLQDKLRLIKTFNPTCGNFSDLEREIIRKIADGKGSNEIMFYTKECEDNNDTGARRILHSFEKERIVFESSANAYPYHPYTLYKALEDPIPTMQKLLALFNWLHSDEFKIELIKDIISEKNYESCYFKQPEPISELEKMRASQRPSLFEQRQIDQKDLIDKLPTYKKKHPNYTKNIIQALYQQVSVTAGKNLTEIFKQYRFNPDSILNDHNSQEDNSSLLNYDDENHDGTKIVFHNKHLSDLIAIGQIDAVMSLLKNKLLITHAKHNEPNNVTTSIIKDTSESLTKSNHIFEIQQWFSTLKTPLIKRKDQIPRLAASILCFDIRFYHSTHHSFIFNSMVKTSHENKLTNIELYKLVTETYMDRCLYKGHNLTDEIYPNRATDSPDAPDKSKPLDVGDLMKDWSSTEDNLIERFRKIQFLTKKHLEIQYFNEKQKQRGLDIEAIIKEQRALGSKKNITYPIGSAFPLPLWLDYSK